MIFVKWVFKDYELDTMGLSFEEDGAYLRMLAVFYKTEKPLPTDEELLMRVCGARTKKEEAAIIKVRDLFWEQTREGWIQKRAQAEISSYQDKCDKLAANGKLGGVPKHKRRLSNPLANGKQLLTSSESESEPSLNTVSSNQKPVTTNQSPSATVAGEVIVLAQVQAWAVEFNRGNVYGIVIEPGWVGEWWDDRTRMDWSVVRSGMAFPIADWQADLRAFARMKTTFASAAGGGQVSRKNSGALGDNGVGALGLPAGVTPSDEPDGWRDRWPELYDFPPPARWLDVPVANRRELLARVAAAQKKTAAAGE